jgi:hypothetical protein
MAIRSVWIPRENKGFCRKYTAKASALLYSRCCRSVVPSFRALTALPDIVSTSYEYLLPHQHASTRHNFSSDIRASISSSITSWRRTSLLHFHPRRDRSSAWTCVQGGRKRGTRTRTRSRSFPAWINERLSQSRSPSESCQKEVDCATSDIIQSQCSTRRTYQEVIVTRALSPTCLLTWCS